MLTGQAKKDYQRDYMREYQRNRRGSKQTVKTQIEVKQDYCCGSLSKERQVSKKGFNL
jgi:hypothetical protein